jgi:hypothetical protein
MHKELIGKEASLSLPCSFDATALVLGFIDELMEVGGGETSDPERLEGELRAAVGAICRPGDDCGQVVVRFAIHDRGVDVLLTCENHGAGEQHVIAAHEA